MRYFLFILLLVFCGCSSYDYKVSSIPSIELSYQELPKEVRLRLSSIKPCDPSTGALLVVDSIDSLRYSLEEVATITGPWISFIKLMGNKKRLAYRIERDVPEPYIIFDGALYIPDRYNILYSDETQKAKYIRYQLR
ncbi:response regulator [Prevotella sp.]